MKIVRDLERSEPYEDGSVLTIGAFDGVHLGHRAVLRLVRELADARGLSAALVTFDRHPAEVVRPGSAPKLLTTLDDRLELLDATGLLDLCLVLTFDEARSHESAEGFVHEVLAGLLHARLVVVGADFHFGHKRGGNVALLEHMGADLGFEVLGLGLVAPQPGSVPFSSTRVRELLAAGDVEGAAEVLGRPHELPGARTAGELRVDERMCIPAPGRYAGTLTESDGSEREAVISVGASVPEATMKSDITVLTGEAGGPRGRVRFRSRIDGSERPGDA
ncbi:MAG: riboflavin kinase / adenylyltransferase [Gaiellales bacterium]|nr:riboflavin kinase / adenylyltransferase [Gaiellales bacterium]